MKFSTYCSFCILLFVLGLPSIVLAQGDSQPISFSLYGGAAIPQGDFGSTTAANAMFANTGFCAMIEGSQVLRRGVNLISSVSVAINSTDESTLDRQVQSLFPGQTLTAGKNITIWSMTGVRLERIASPTVKFYGLGQIGLLLSKPTDITLSSDSLLITQTTKTGKAFAYGFGVGIIINKFNLGIRYCAGKPEHEQTASAWGRVSTAKFKASVAVLQLMFGISL